MLPAPPASSAERDVPPARPPLSSTLQWVTWSVLGLLVAAIVASFVRQEWIAAETRASVPLDRFGQVPDFTLTERSGQPFSSQALRGKIWLADFFFTACPGPCLVMNGRMAEIGQALSRDHADVPLVSFSIAPEQDTPEVLRKYAQRFQAPADRWSFLTGDHATIYRLARQGFLLPVQDNSAGPRNPDEGEFIHSTRISLVDRAGVVRGTFDSARPEVTQEVLIAVGRLLREQPPQPARPPRA